MVKRSSMNLNIDESIELLIHWNSFYEMINIFNIGWAILWQSDWYSYVQYWYVYWYIYWFEYYDNIR